MESYTHRLSISSCSWQYSGHSWFVKRMTGSGCQRPTTTTVIDHLHAYFARFGIPITILSNNTSEFVCAQPRGWVGGQWLPLAAYHCITHGLAEIMATVIKDAMECSVQAFIHCLLMYIAIRHWGVIKTPSKIMLSRTLHCPTISHLRPMQLLLYESHSKATGNTSKIFVQARLKHSTSGSQFAWKGHLSLPIQTRLCATVKGAAYNSTVSQFLELIVVIAMDQS